MAAAPELRSRVFRCVVTQEILAVVPHGVLVNVADGLVTAEADGVTDGADFGAIVREAVQGADCGRHCWVTAGESSVSTITELTEGGSNDG